MWFHLGTDLAYPPHRWLDVLKGIPCEQLFALVLEIKNHKRAMEAEARKKREARALQNLAKARASLIPALRIQFTRAGIEWCR